MSGRAEIEIVKALIDYLDQHLREQGLFRKQGLETEITTCLHFLYQGSFRKVRCLAVRRPQAVVTL